MAQEIISVESEGCIGIGGGQERFSYGDYIVRLAVSEKKFKSVKIRLDIPLFANTKL